MQSHLSPLFAARSRLDGETKRVKKEREEKQVGEGRKEGPVRVRPLRSYDVNFQEGRVLRCDAMAVVEVRALSLLLRKYILGREWDTLPLCPDSAPRRVANG